jgi:transposase
MFVRRKQNKSGSVSVQIVEKRHGRYAVIRTVGCTKDPDEAAQLTLKAKDIIVNPEGQLRLFSIKSRNDLVIENFLTQLKNADIRTLGPEIIFGSLFDRIGFNIIRDELFRHIVIARLAYPTSKLKTVDYLRRYRGIEMDVAAVYRFLDRLSHTYKEKVQRIAYEYTKNALRGRIAVVFYDMTTLYFESEDEDDLRKIGFSKDGKFQQPQIMLGLLVGEGGLPIGYDIFKGNTFEGHTLLPTLKNLQQTYGFSQPIVVADAALLSNDNLENLSHAHYQFIIGARIKNESHEVKQKILIKASGMKNGHSFTIRKDDEIKLVVTYSEKRARKDARNRERGVRKLREQLKTNKLTKEHVNNRGYNKFLRLTGEIRVEVDEQKVEEDKRWDGLKGYMTNTRLPAKKIVANYGHLWQIEKAFRISKTDLRVRPIFHRRQHRIEAHICIAFVAYTIYKELERLLSKYRAGMSPKRAAELTHTMYELTCVLPGAVKRTNVLLKMDEEQQILYDIIRKSG